MDETTVRRFAEEHGEAMRKGDLNRAAEDLTADARDQAGPVMKGLPRPITSAEVTSVETSGDDYIVQIRYAGGDDEAIVESRWGGDDDRPRILDLRLV